MFSGEATHTNFKVFGLTRSGAPIHDIPHSRRAG